MVRDRPESIQMRRMAKRLDFTPQAPSIRATTRPRQGYAGTSPADQWDGRSPSSPRQRRTSRPLLPLRALNSLCPQTNTMWFAEFRRTEYPASTRTSPKHYAHHEVLFLQPIFIQAGSTRASEFLPKCVRNRPRGNCGRTHPHLRTMWVQESNIWS